MTKSILAEKSVWKNVVSELSLEIGKAYSIQNTGSNVILISESASEPTGSDYHKLNPKVFQSIVPELNLGIWIKGNIFSSKLVVTG